MNFVFVNEHVINTIKLGIFALSTMFAHQAIKSISRAAALIDTVLKRGTPPCFRRILGDGVLGLK